MNPGQLFHDLLFDYTLRNIALGSAVLGIVSGVLGSFALLRRQSLLGDTLSHAALPGVCLAFILSGQSKAPLALMIGAAAAGWVGALLMTVTLRNTRIKEDAAMGVVLSVFFGTGYVLLTLLQKWAGSGQAGLDKYLFGRAASLMAEDVRTMAILGVVTLAVTFLLFKEFKSLSFDPAFLASQGFPVRGLDILLTSLIVVAVVIGLQTVGVVLMSAMLIAPGAAARQWTNRLSRMIGVAALVGAASGVIGAVISATADRTPTGPAIVLVLTAATLLSLAFGAERGLLWQWLRRRSTWSAIRAEMALIDLYRIAPTYAVPESEIPHSARTLRKLAHAGWAAPSAGNAWTLTEAGVSRAAQLVASRSGANRPADAQPASLPADGRKGVGHDVA